MGVEGSVVIKLDNGVVYPNRKDNECGMIFGWILSSNSNNYGKSSQIYSKSCSVIEFY